MPRPKAWAAFVESARSGGRPSARACAAHSAAPSPSARMLCSWDRIAARLPRWSGDSWSPCDHASVASDSAASGSPANQASRAWRYTRLAVGGVASRSAASALAVARSPSIRNRLTASRRRSSDVGASAAHTARLEGEVRGGVGVAPRQVRCGRGGEPIGQVVVGAVRRGDQVMEGGVAGEQLPGARVQGCSGMGPRSSYTAARTRGCGKRTVQPRGPSVGIRMAGERLSSSSACCGCSTSATAATRSITDPSGSRAAALASRWAVSEWEARVPVTRQGVRRRRRQRVRGEERLGRELVQQCPEVQRAAVGVLAQPCRSGASPVPGSEALRLDELDDLGLAQAVDVQPVPVGVGQPEQPRREPRHLVVPGHEDREHRVRGQPPEREGQRTQGRGIGEVGVVHDEHGRLPVTEPVEVLQHGSAGGERVLPRAVRGAEQLADDPELEKGLGLVTRGVQGADVAQPVQEGRDQRALADAGWSVDDHRRRPSPRPRSKDGSSSQSRSAARPTNSGIGI